MLALSVLNRPRLDASVLESVAEEVEGCEFTGDVDALIAKCNDLDPDDLCVWVLVRDEHSGVAELEPVFSFQRLIGLLQGLTWSGSDRYLLKFYFFDEDMSHHLIELMPDEDIEE